MQLLLLLLLLPLLAPAAEYVQFDSSQSQCLCWWRLPNSIFCQLLPLSANSSEADTSCSSLSCLPLSSISFDCRQFTSSSRVHVHEMTRSHECVDSGSRVPPPRSVELDGCRADSDRLSFRQTLAENVSSRLSMELLQFGPVWPKVAAHLIVRRNFSAASAHGCRLSSLTVTNGELLNFPSYLVVMCPNLGAVEVLNCSMQALEVQDLLALSQVKSVRLRNCLLPALEVMTPYQVAMRRLNRLLDGGLPASTSNLTVVAFKQLQELRERVGLLMDPKVVFLELGELRNISFTFVMASRSSRHKGSLPVPSATVSLDLSGNQLTAIPLTVSMLGNLFSLNLSHNGIASVYSHSMCWDPASEHPHCYWFRAAADKLRILDLSHNLIEIIGQVEPWFGVALGEVNLSNNRLFSLHPLAFANSLLTKSLLTLRLDNNYLKGFELQSLQRIEQLSLEGNRVAQIGSHSIPRSTNLSHIFLASNEISSIVNGSFRHLEALKLLDLRNNSNRFMHANQFIMPKRKTLASRVLLLFSGQSERFCDCDHVYIASRIEEQLEKVTEYIYPRLMEKETSSFTCKFFDIFVANRTRSLILSRAKSSYFICPFYGDTRVTVPSPFCNSSRYNKCITKCFTSCYCWRGIRWFYSDAICESTKADPFNAEIYLPIKKLVLRNNTGVGLTGKFTKDTLKWKSPILEKQLLYLTITNCRLTEIVDFAFQSNHSIKALNLSGNHLKVIGPNSFVGLERKLQELYLTGNKLRVMNLSIFNGFYKLGFLYLSGNPWRCSCSQEWRLFHQQLLHTAATSQIVSDFQKMKCDFDQEFLEEFSSFKAANPSCTFAPSSQYNISDGGSLLRLCSQMADFQEMRRRQLVKWLMVSLGSLLGLLLLVALVVKRHMIWGATEMYFILKYMQLTRRREMRRGSFEFDVFFLGDDDEDLADVMTQLQSAFEFYKLTSSCSLDFAVHTTGGSGLLQQTKFESIADGVQFSRTVVVLLSRSFLHTQFHHLLQVVDEMTNSGRSCSEHVLLLRMSPDLTNADVSPESQPYSSQVQGAISVLFRRGVRYNSRDWQYQLALSIFKAKFAGWRRGGDRDDAAAAAGGDAEGDDMERQLLPAEELMASHNSSAQPQLRDFAPFTGNDGCDVFIAGQLSQSQAAVQLTRSLLSECARRRLKLGTCEQRLAAANPGSFELRLPGQQQLTDAALKQTRQFVLLLSCCGHAAGDSLQLLLPRLRLLQQRTRVRRRILVFVDSDVSDETAGDYRQLVNCRLQGQEPGNDFCVDDSRDAWKLALYCKQRRSEFTSIVFASSRADNREETELATE